MNRTGKRGLLIASLGVALVGLITAVALTSAGSGGSSETNAGGGSADGAAPPRTLVVSSEGMPSPSQPGSPLHAKRLSGPVPRAAAGTVLSDERCTPDASGLSRCVNRVRLSSGQVLSVRHPHRMMEIPCLSPGEKVIVRRA